MITAYNPTIIKKNDDWAIKELSTNHHPLFYLSILNKDNVT